MKKTVIDELIEEVNSDIKDEDKKDIIHNISMKNSFLNKEQIRLRKVLKRLEAKKENHKKEMIDIIVDFQKQKRLKNPIIALGDNWKECDEKYIRDLAEDYYNKTYLNE